MNIETKHAPHGFEPATEPPQGKVRVWDTPTRLFHWTLVGLVITAWLTGGSGDRLHEIAGFAAAGLLAFRLLWGMVGTQHARFSDFVVSPFSVVRYLAAIARMRAPRHLGHNPAGGLMIIILLLVLIVVVVSGMMMLSNRFFGLTWVEQTHKYAVDALLVGIAIHIFGVIISSWMHQENLVGAMVTGMKPVEAGQARPTAAQQMSDRMRGLEGLVMLVGILIASSGVGIYITNGRTAQPVMPSIAEENRPPLEKAVASGDNALARAAAQANFIVGDKQDYATGGPSEGSRAWLVAAGGRLYDNWYAALGLPPPRSQHPSWPATNATTPPEATWRCKSCHGWDYLGRDGQYKSGTTATGIVGIARARGRDVERIATILGDNTHRYTDEILPPNLKARLALFVSQGQHVVSRYIEASGQVKGDPVQGRAIFQTVCAACHGFDGRARRLGISSDPTMSGPALYVGSKARSNPTEVLHKVRNGHPGAVMVNLRAFPMEAAVNLVAYAQTLPKE